MYVCIRMLRHPRLTSTDVRSWDFCASARLRSLVQSGQTRPGTSDSMEEVTTSG